MIMMPTPDERQDRLERFGSAFDEIERYESARGWDVLGCQSECGECYTCGLKQAVSSIKTMLITPGAVERWETRADHQPSEPEPKEGQ